MNGKKPFFQRQSIRLKGYDYSQAGAYFITLVTKNRLPLFGEITNGEMNLDQYGEIIQNEWFRTPEIRKEIMLDEFIIMPNYIHAIVVIEDPVGLSAQNSRATGRSPLQEKPTISSSSKFIHLQSTSPGAFIAGFKAATIIQIIRLRSSPGAPVWIRNYYEHIIRSESELDRIRLYIQTNPSQWDQDKYFL